MNVLEAPALLAHNDQEAEWWYVHGHVASSVGRYAFHLAFFRHRTDNVHAGAFFPVRWLGRQLRFAHVAVTERDAGRFHFAHRRTLGTDAGASTSAFQVWHGDWALSGTPEGCRLAAAVKGIRLELELHPQKPLLRFPEASHTNDASAYDSCPRLRVSGRVWQGGRAHDAQGDAWLDHEHGRLGMCRDRHGWDWFGLHLDEGRELLVYGLRGRDGAWTPHAFAALIESDGSVTAIPANQVEVAPLAWTRSPLTGIVYPVEWRLRIGDPALDLRVTARLKCHELDTRGSTCVIYWEGPVDCKGLLRGQPATGCGFVERTGCDSVPDRSGIFDFERDGLDLAGGLANEWRFLRHRNGVTRTDAGWPVSHTPSRQDR